MVAEACQESGTVFTGNTYNGYGDIFHKEIAGSPKESLCDITPPWTGTPITDEVLTEDIPETYSSGTERYVVTMHDGFIGETASAEFTECWYTDDGNRYVKTTGSNSALGNNWANAWVTTGYGFQNIPSSKDLYVEEGLYGGETLSNINPPQTTSVYIQPSGHTEARCNVVITDDSTITNFSSGGIINANIQNVTWLQLASSIAQNSTLYSIDMICGLSGYSGTFKFKVFRDDGTNYVFIGESEARTLAGASTDLIKIAFDGIEVLSGDLIAVSGGGAAPTIKFAVSGAAAKFKVGDITTTSLKSSWTSGGSMNVGIKTYGV